MTKLSVLYWQDIPTVVEGKDKEGIHKVELSNRFSELVDMVAMLNSHQGFTVEKHSI